MLSTPRLPSLVLSLLTGVMSLLLAGCWQTVFVGYQPVAPQPLVVLPADRAPVPPFGPRPFLPLDFVPGPAPQIEEPLDAPAGPAFAWSATENILILGTDRRPNDGSWRTDTIMVVGLDRTLNRAAVLSVPRDLYLEIPNYGYNRINMADYIGEQVLKLDGGGPALVSAVLSQTFGIETHHWVRFEMTGFESVVDAVGGVTVNLDCPFYEPILNLDTGAWEYFTLPAGQVHLDGEAAYWFVRLRLKESDIGRAKRQRQFLWAMRDQVLSANLILRFPELWTAFHDTYSTDLTLLQLMDLVRFGVALEPANVRASGITLKELRSYTTDRGASVLVIDDPAKVQAVVDGIWDAPAMVDTNRKDATKCEPLPGAAPAVATDRTAPDQPQNPDQAQLQSQPQQPGQPQPQDQPQPQAPAQAPDQDQPQPQDQPPPQDPAQEPLPGETAAGAPNPDNEGG